MGNIGLQLYSIKELTGVDFFKTLTDVAEAGYDAVEFAGFFDAPAGKLRKVLDDNGLKVCGSHTGMDLLSGSLDQVMEYNAEIGNEYIICPGIPENMRNSEGAWKKTSQLFNDIGMKLKSAGFKFGYHNHYEEFNIYNGKYGYDILGENTDPDLVLMQIDTYWVEYAGLKSVDFMDKYRDRLDVIHIKDMKSLEDKRNTEIGNGIMDFGKIIEKAKEYGTKWYIVEQEYFEMPQLESIKISCDNLRNLLK